jgi:hypothetical protein
VTRRAVALSLSLLSALALSACADTLQNRPISHSDLERMMIAPYPVYWLGGSFRGIAIREASRDVGGAFRVQYGNCVQGGQSTCVPRVRVVTSPDNSFLPGLGVTPLRATRVRGVPAHTTPDGRTIELTTGPVVVSIHSPSRRLAAAASTTMVAINQPGAPGAALPTPLPDTGFASAPLPVQLPPALHAPAARSR